MGAYDQAQICLHGHVANDTVRRHPEFNQKFCKTCGAETITACPGCKAPIRGDYHVDGFIGGGSTFDRPGFCIECGVAYPWTAEGIEAAQELALELEGLKDDDLKLLQRSLDDIVTDNPSTQLAVLRIKKILAKAKGPAVNLLKDAAISIATEVARKALMGA